MRGRKQKELYTWTRNNRVKKKKGEEGAAIFGKGEKLWKGPLKGKFG